MTVISLRQGIIENKYLKLMFHYRMKLENHLTENAQISGFSLYVYNCHKEIYFAIISYFGTMQGAKFANCYSIHLYIYSLTVSYSKKTKKTLSAIILLVHFIKVPKFDFGS